MTAKKEITVDGFCGGWRVGVRTANVNLVVLKDAVACCMICGEILRKMNGGFGDEPNL